MSYDDPYGMAYDNDGYGYGDSPLWGQQAGRRRREQWHDPATKARLDALRAGLEQRVDRRQKAAASRAARRGQTASQIHGRKPVKRTKPTRTARQASKGKATRSRR